MKSILTIITFTIFLVSLSSCDPGERSGAICNDGWKSNSTGRGTCSSHGGVDHWIHEND